MNYYNSKRCYLERKMRIQRNKSYPILFNRINWKLIDESIDELIEFQKTHDDILPFSIIYGCGDENFKKFDKIIANNDDKFIKFEQSRHNEWLGVGYDGMYEFIQKYPQWKKIVFYEEDPNKIYDEYLTTHYKNYPLLFNRINWRVVDAKINELYNLVQKEKKLIIPPVLFMYSPNNISKNYKEIAYKIYKYYKSEESKGNKSFKNWLYSENGEKRYNYDSVFEFIQAYPEFSDIVYFDEEKV